MNFANAHNGVKKIFTAEILSLVVYFIYLGYLSKAKRMLEG